LHVVYLSNIIPHNIVVHKGGSLDPLNEFNCNHKQIIFLNT